MSDRKHSSHVVMNKKKTSVPSSLGVIPEIPGAKEDEARIEILIRIQRSSLFQCCHHRTTSPNRIIKYEGQTQSQSQI
jgi:hypothetical protein